MMMTFLVLKSRIKTFYEKHYHVCRCVIKMLCTFFALLLVTHNMDYSNVLGQYGLLAVLAVLCGFSPDMVSAGVLFFVAIAEMACAVPVVGASVFLSLVIYFLLLGRMERGQAYVILAVPVLSMLQLGCLVPIVAALFVSPVMIPAMLFGIALQYTMTGVAEYTSVAASVAEASNPVNPDHMLMPFRYMTDYLRHNSLFAVTVFAFTITFLCIYLLRRAAFKYSSQIAIMAGVLVYLVTELFANILWDLGIHPLRSILQALAAMALAYIIQFFRITLDYHGTRKLQFEDDEYYYYVTAIPKYKVAVTDKTVTRIVPGEDLGETMDLKEELEKTLEEEAGDSDSEW